MEIKFNSYTMNKVALLGNGTQIIEHFGRFYAVKKCNTDWYKLFFNTSSFQQAVEYASKM